MENVAEKQPKLTIRDRLILLHDNVCTYIGNLMQLNILQLDLEIIDHAPPFQHHRGKNIHISTVCIKCIPSIH